jgi:hypothetical protein
MTRLEPHGGEKVMVAGGVPGDIGSQCIKEAKKRDEGDQKKEDDFRDVELRIWTESNIAYKGTEVSPPDFAEKESGQGGEDGGDGGSEEPDETEEGHQEGVGENAEAESARGASGGERLGAEDFRAEELAESVEGEEEDGKEEDGLDHWLRSPDGTGS